MRNLPLTFDCMYCSQKLGEDFAKLCALLRIYELYYLRVYAKTADNFWDTFSKVYRTFTVSFIVLSVIALFRLTF